MSNNKQSKYLLYTQWTSRTASGSKVGGSILHDLLIMTEEQAQIELRKVQSNHADFANDFPDLFSKDRITTFVYIENDPDWWS